MADKMSEYDRITKLICNLLRLNLKQFQDLYLYKHTFNSFQADLNTHLTTIVNQQQTILNDSKTDSIEQNKRKTKELMQTKQKISDMICEKFLQTCSDLGQPGDYESSIYSILGIVDSFNSTHQNESEFFDDQSNSDSELNCLSKQIESFLRKLNCDGKFRSLLLEQLFEKLIDDDHESIDGDPIGNHQNDPMDEMQCENIDTMAATSQQIDFCNVVENVNHQSGSNRKLMKLSSVNHRFQCRFCGALFEQFAMLIQHQRRQHRSPRHACSRCKQTFRNEYVLKIHLRKNCCSVPRTNENSAESIDSFAIKNASSGEMFKAIAQNNYSTDRNHLCPWPGCGKTFTRGSYLTNHMMAHSKERNFVCDWPDCEKRYKTKAHLLNHVVLHQQKQSKSTESIDERTSSKHDTDFSDLNSCPSKDCSMNFETEYDLIEHYHQVHLERKKSPINLSVLDTTTPMIEDGGQENPIESTRLEVQNNSKAKQTNTINSNGEENRFQCEYCGTVFSKKSSLSNHVKSHSGQIACSWNGCSFRSHSSIVLSRHMMSHKDYITVSNVNQNDESYTCKLCGKMFNKRASIINHVRSHSGQYSCQWPGCHFASQSKMLYRRHVVSANHDLERIESQSSTTSDSLAQNSINNNNNNNNGNGNVLEQKNLKSNLENGNGGIQTDSNEASAICANNRFQTEINSNSLDKSALNKPQIVDRNDQPQAIRVFHCRFPNCSYQTPKRPLFRVHMLRHSEIRKHRCSWPRCAKSFKAKSTLNRHLVRHQQLLNALTSKSINQNHNDSIDMQNLTNDLDQERNKQQILSIKTEDESIDSLVNNESATSSQFECDLCHLLFRTKSALSNHQISHRKPQLRCMYPGCFYETFRSATLQRHEHEIHGKTSKVYPCTYKTCAKLFGSWSELQQDLLEHQKQNKFVCYWPGCGETFETRSKYAQHLELHQRKRTHPCRQCNKIFDSKFRLLEHNRSVHHRSIENKTEPILDSTNGF
ncbi:hypothetical protein QR98_0056720 [Sarcoptes scabiei]|uniref:C2H2-type domain-containing protein n=1 Tax=Sarcoptes scabiei TaxID=52283 RepID=A0A132A885_SARSC|nr:hypothetical protein QR98_0056720 [Sarcoptes scabiei]